MHGDRAGNEARLQALCSGVATLSGVQVAIAPPLVYFDQVQRSLSGASIRLAAQEVSEHELGPWTGQHAAVMLQDFSCALVLAGHSECRQAGRTDEQVARQLQCIVAHGMQPVLCVGETLAEYDAGETLSVVERQLQSLLVLSPEDWRRVLIAYEPVWAIGSGRVATPAHAQHVHAAVRAWLARQQAQVAMAVPLLYGGSVKVENATALLSQPDVDGVLVGGASLKADEFLQLCRQAECCWQSPEGA